MECQDCCPHLAQGTQAHAHTLTHTLSHFHIHVHTHTSILELFHVQVTEPTIHLAL